VGDGGLLEDGIGHSRTTVVANIIIVALIRMHVHEKEMETSKPSHNRGAVYEHDDDE